MSLHAWRDDPQLVLLEGFHAIKHALRFGADVQLVATADPDGLTELARRLAPDVHERLVAAAQMVSREELKAAAGGVPHTKVVAFARRPAADAERRRALAGEGHLVLLEDPRHLGNVGAVVRVAAAAGAGGVVTTGERDPWDPAALRGAAGLHFALPVGQLDDLTWLRRPVVVFDPDGPALSEATIPSDAVLAFGTERDGISADLAHRADAAVALPMRAGVSSLNLATAVAAALYVLACPRQGSNLRASA